MSNLCFKYLAYTNRKEGEWSRNMFTDAMKEKPNTGFDSSCCILVTFSEMYWKVYSLFCCVYFVRHYFLLSYSCVVFFYRCWSISLAIEKYEAVVLSLISLIHIFLITYKSYGLLLRKSLSYTICLMLILKCHPFSFLEIKKPTSAFHNVSYITPESPVGIWWITQ